MSEQPIPPVPSPSTQNPGTSPARPPESSGQAIASLVLGILSLTCFGLFSGIPAIILGKGATRKIRESAGLLTGTGLAQAGIITGWIGTILSLGVIAVFVGLPLFTSQMQSKRQEVQLTTCINNLRQIDAAKQQWALENRAAATAEPTWENIRPYLGRGASSTIPQCPVGGPYVIGNIEALPKCSVPGHTIE